MTERSSPRKKQDPVFDSAEMGALAHLYRGEMYRSKIWRTRLDTTTNWAVVTTGIALSVTFSDRDNSPLTLILVGLLVVLFMCFEARRYRYFDIWRTRVRLLETCFYSPILRGEGVTIDNGWNRVLAEDYGRLRFHISYTEALGRRLRRNYSGIFALLLVAWLVKLFVHPTPLESPEAFWNRAAAGPVSGQVVLTVSILFHLGLLLLGLLTVGHKRAAGRVPWRKDRESHDPIVAFMADRE